MAILISIQLTFTRFPAKSASTMHAVLKRLRWISIPALRILKADRLMLPPAAEFWLTLADLSANTAGLIVRLQPSPLHKLRLGPCSVITGIRYRVTWRNWNRRSTSAKLLLNVHFAAWEHAK